jgi:hypothetical protein
MCGRVCREPEARLRSPDFKGRAVQVLEARRVLVIGLRGGATGGAMSLHGGDAAVAPAHKGHLRVFLGSISFVFSGSGPEKHPRLLTRVIYYIEQTYARQV